MKEKFYDLIEKTKNFVIENGKIKSKYHFIPAAGLGGEFDINSHGFRYNSWKMKIIYQKKDINGKEFSEEFYIFNKNYFKSDEILFSKVNGKIIENKLDEKHLKSLKELILK